MVTIGHDVEAVEKISQGTIQRRREGPVWIVVMHGEHDLSTAPNLAHELEQAFDAGAPVVVDLTEVEFMDSAILNALLKAREQALARQEGSFAAGRPSWQLSEPGAGPRRRYADPALPEPQRGGRHPRPRILTERALRRGRPALRWNKAPRVS